MTSRRPWHDLPDPDGPPPTSLADGLAGLARRLGLPPPDTLSRVFGLWPQVAGQHLASRARPVALAEGGRLVLVVDDPAWARQLEFLETELLERLADAGLGAEVTSIEVRAPRAPRTRWTRRGSSST